MFRDFSCIKWENREKNFYFIFLEVEVLDIVLWNFYFNNYREEMCNYTTFYSFLYKLQFWSFLFFFLLWMQIISSVNFLQPEEIASVFFLRQVCQQWILSFCLPRNVFTFIFWKGILLDIELLVDSFFKKNPSDIWICHRTSFYPPWLHMRSQLLIWLGLSCM